MQLNLKRIFMLALFLAVVVSLQKSFADDGHFHPDSLTAITVTGNVIVDSSFAHARYFLDADNDGQADYFLNFGPWWYEPDSSGAVRPSDGQTVTIEGGVEKDDEHNTFSVIVVYQIDGKFWRNPTEPTWDMMGGHQNGMGHHNNMGFAFGWMHDSLRTVALSGTVIADTTFVFTNFYLDTNSDSLPDYFLNFGPPWYQPANGIQRPRNGDFINLTAGLLKNHEIPMLLVYTLNGQEWRDSTVFGPHFGGGWIYENMKEGRYIYSPFDSLDGMFVHPGWKNGMGHGHNGGMMSDSLFAQILEVFPQNIPNRGQNHVLAGYEIAMFNPDGSNNMWMDGMNGGHINFNSNVDYKLHYTDIQLQGERINEATIEVKYWDDRSQSWVSVSDAVLNQQENTITFSSDEVSNYVILSGEQAFTSVSEQPDLTVKGFSLEQNYPNPFNPVTTIIYRLAQSAQVRLTVYNGLGQRIRTLISGIKSAGEHRFTFNAQALSSGTYYYELNVNGKSIVKKMNLIK